MNVYECNGTNIFGEAELMVHFIFHRMKIFVPLHEWENIHYLFYVPCTKIQILKQITKKKKHWKMILAHKAKHFTTCASNSTRKVLRGRTAPVAFAPRRVSHRVCLLASS